MEKAKILVIGRHTEMLEKITQMLQRHGYQPFGCLTNDEALRAFRSENFRAVVIGGGVDQASRVLFHTTFKKEKPSVHIIDTRPQTILQDLEQVFRQGN